MDNNIEKNKFWVNAIAVIAIPIVIAWVGNSYSSAVKEKEIQARLVEIAINILNEPLDSVNSKENLRLWSVKVINKYSDVTFDKTATQDLIYQTPLLTTNKNFIPYLLYQNSQFKGKPIKINPKFAKSLNLLNEFASKLKIDMYVVSSLRVASNNSEKKSKSFSSHNEGLAIDVNLILKNKLYNSSQLSPNNLENLPQEIQTFIIFIRNESILKWGGDFEIPDPTHIEAVLDE